LSKIVEITNKLSQEFGIYPKIAAEVEFYLIGNEAKHNDILALCIFGLNQAQIFTDNLNKETGSNQYEICIKPYNNIPQLVNDVEKLKEIISKAAKSSGAEANFAAKPFKNMPGSGLHFHISLHDKSGKNLLCRVNDKQNESEIMLHSIGGLCATMLENFIYFAPHEESYERFTYSLNPADESNPMQAHNNAPTNVSWGGNNRTTAIRIPVSTINEEFRRIEHRVAGADANAAEVIEKILEGVYSGIKNKTIPPEKIWGNAYDKQYSSLPPFPKTLEEAKKLANN
jgi:glutamine synthetase